VKIIPSLARPACLQAGRDKGELIYFGKILIEQKQRINKKLFLSKY